MLVKIFLTPLLILMCLLVARRWGSFVGGVIAGLPLISGLFPFSSRWSRARLFCRGLIQHATWGAGLHDNGAHLSLACRLGHALVGSLPAALCGFFGGGWAVLHFYRSRTCGQWCFPRFLRCWCSPACQGFWRCKQGHTLSAGVRVPIQSALLYYQGELYQSMQRDNLKESTTASATATVSLRASPTASSKARAILIKNHPLFRQPLGG